MLASTPTEELLERARAGDRDAWGALTARFTQRVRVALMAEGHSMEEAKDLAQEAWASIWSRHARGELPDLQLPGLIVTHARFLAKNLRRHQRLVAALTPEPDDVAPAADEAFVARETVENARRALNVHNPQHRRIFWAAIEAQRAHADIAQDEGLSIQRVRQIIWEVRCTLRERLEHSVEAS